MNQSSFSRSRLNTNLKNNALKLLAASLFCFSASASAFDEYTIPATNQEPVTCENGKNYADIFRDIQPFSDIDQEKAISQLPAEDAKQLLLIETQLNRLEETLETAEDIDDETEFELLSLAEQAAQIIEKNDIQFEMVNMLDNLTETQKDEAIRTWCELAEKLEQQNEQEQQIDNLFSKLDKLLNKAEVKRLQQ